MGRGGEVREDVISVFVLKVMSLTAGQKHARVRC